MQILKNANIVLPSIYRDNDKTTCSKKNQINRLKIL